MGTDFRALHSELLSFGGYRTTGARSLAAAQLTPEWLQQNGAFKPVLIPAAPAAARELGITLPEGSLTVDRLASRIGIATEVGGLVMPLWCRAPDACVTSSMPALLWPHRQLLVLWLRPLCASAHAAQVHTMDVQTQGEGPRWTLHQVRSGA